MQIPRSEHSSPGSGTPGDGANTVRHDRHEPLDDDRADSLGATYGDTLEGPFDGAGAESFFAGVDDYTGPIEPDTRAFQRHVVTAVLVAHNGARWLPKTLTALRRLTRQPQLVIAVDTGSTDATSLLLAKALGASAVVTMPRDTGFGSAVHHVVDAGKNAPGLPSEPGADGPPVEWLWLLHDDSAPDPEALRQLLVAVDTSPSIAIAGPKVRAGPTRRSSSRSA